MKSSLNTIAPTPLTVQKFVANKKVAAAAPTIDENGKTILFMDQIRHLAIRDVSKLQPGDDVLFLHVPQLALEDPEYLDCTLNPHYFQVKIDGISNKNFRQLHPNLTDPIHTEPAMVLEFEGNFGRNYRYLGDCGVEAYGVNVDGEKSYNSTNFTVLVSDLEAAGIALKLEVSPEYKAKLDKINAEFNKRPRYEYPYDY